MKNILVSTQLDVVNITKINYRGCRYDNIGILEKRSFGREGRSSEVRLRWVSYNPTSASRRCLGQHHHLIEERVVSDLDITLLRRELLVVVS